MRRPSGGASQYRARAKRRVKPRRRKPGKPWVPYWTILPGDERRWS